MGLPEACHDSIIGMVADITKHDMRWLSVEVWASDLVIMNHQHWNPQAWHCRSPAHLSCCIVCAIVQVLLDCGVARLTLYRMFGRPHAS